MVPAARISRSPAGRRRPPPGAACGGWAAPAGPLITRTPRAPRYHSPPPHPCDAAFEGGPRVPGVGAGQAQPRGVGERARVQPAQCQARGEAAARAAEPRGGHVRGREHEGAVGRDPQHDALRLSEPWRTRTPTTPPPRPSPSAPLANRRSTSTTNRPLASPCFLPWLAAACELTPKLRSPPTAIFLGLALAWWTPWRNTPSARKNRKEKKGTPSMPSPAPSLANQKRKRHNQGRVADLPNKQPPRTAKAPPCVRRNARNNRNTNRPRSPSPHLASLSTASLSTASLSPPRQPHNALASHVAIPRRPRPRFALRVLTPRIHDHTSPSPASPRASSLVP